jgi:hypothetical protein
MILDLFHKEVEFENIHGYDDLKDIVRRALDTEDNYSLLFIGPPASAKTLFLLGIIEYKKGVIDPNGATSIMPAFAKRTSILSFWRFLNITENQQPIVEEMN